MARRLVAIDGASGTVGMTLMDRLAAWADIEVAALGSKTSAEERAAVLARAEIAILCLPEGAARAAVAAAPAGLRILDASPAHRTVEGWVYGLPELSPQQPDAVRHALRVANPGCYATGAILLLRPFAAELADYPVSITAVGGYTSGGKRMVDAFEKDAFGYRLYGLDLAHRHVPEITRFAQLNRAPIFMPAVVAHAQGTLVQAPLHLPTLGLTLTDLRQRLTESYRDTAVIVKAAGREKLLDAAALAGQDGIELGAFADSAGENVVLTAQFDNLGKGAAGAAEQNLALMLGI